MNKKQLAELVAIQQALQAQQKKPTKKRKAKRKAKQKKGDSTVGLINFLLLCGVAGIGFLIFTGA